MIKDLDLFESIADKQLALASQPLDSRPPLHHPEMLYIGCIDARLDPIDDIGIPKGKALIFRNIGAIVRPSSEREPKQVLDTSMMTTNEVPENISLGAALEFFLKYMPKPEKGPKHIVVSGHTDCGGIRCCLGHIDKHPDDYYLPRYLSALEPLAEMVHKLFTGKTEEDKRNAQLTLEQRSVKQSIDNLRSYEVVREAEKAGKVMLHGWVIDTANSKIEEYVPTDNKEECKFVPFTDTKYVSQVRSSRVAEAGFVSKA